MAYKIRYGPAKPAKRPPAARKLLLTLCFFALFLLCAWYFAGEELLALRQSLIPFVQVDALLQQLREGEDFADAVAAFCQDVLDGR